MLDDWQFEVIEVSANVFKAKGLNKNGCAVEAFANSADEALKKAETLAAQLAEE